MASGDERWWWTGRRWVQVPPALVWPRSLLCAALAWLVLLGGAPIVATEAAGRGKVPASFLLGVGGVAVTATLGLGVALGWSRRWRHCGVAALGGTAALLVAYAFAMVTQPGGGDANAAGAGVVLFGPPVLAIIAALLALGAGTGAAGRRLARA